MALIKEMVGLKVISGFRGVIDFYYYMGIPCARRWPRKPAHDRSAPVKAQWPIFTRAVELWAEISSEVRQAYEDMAVSTNLTARDMFIKGYISGTLKYYTPPDELPVSE